MKIVKGNKILDLNEAELKQILNYYKYVCLDLGTGDGRFVYENAKKFPNRLFIGVDPSQKQLEIYSKKAAKNRLSNTLFVPGSIEHLPAELVGTTDELSIILPWGTLLKNIVSPSQESTVNLYRLLKQRGQLRIILGYAPENEPSETRRLELPKISIDLLKEKALPIFESVGFRLGELTIVPKNFLKTLPTTWGKKLTFGMYRPIYKMILFKEVL